jgi:hypothetical protein
MDAYFFVGGIRDGGGSGTLIPAWAVGAADGTSMVPRPMAMAASASTERRDIGSSQQGLLQSRALAYIPSIRTPSSDLFAH